MGVGDTALTRCYARCDGKPFSKAMWTVNWNTNIFMTKVSKYLLLQTMSVSWWRNNLSTLSVLLRPYGSRNPSVTCGFSYQRDGNAELVCFVVVTLDKLLKNIYIYMFKASLFTSLLTVQSRGWWNETLYTFQCDTVTILGTTSSERDAV